MLPVSAISDAANKVRSLLLDQISDLSDIKNIKIGHPKDTFEGLEKDINHLNLFFYNVKYDGYPADGTSDNPFYVRMYCLITAIGAMKDSSPVSSGENDLRLIGEVMRVLHEQPVISVDKGDDVEIAQLQIIPHFLDLDNLNHIWSTQGETAYRLSVAYEMALAPIPLAGPTERSALAGDPHMLSWGAMERPKDKEKDGIISLKPGVDFLQVDTGKDNWVPHICYVEEIDVDTKELQYVYKVEGSLTGQLDILIAGKENAKLKFFWNVWRRKTDNNVVAWKENIADAVVPAEKELKNPPAATEPFYPERIDPENIDERRLFKAELPADVNDADTKTWQAVLYATYEWEHEEPEGSGDTVKTIIKSNPILFYGTGSGT